MCGALAGIEPTYGLNPSAARTSTHFRFFFGELCQRTPVCALTLLTLLTLLTSLANPLNRLRSKPSPYRCLNNLFS